MHHVIKKLVTDFNLNFQICTKDISHMIKFIFYHTVYHNACSCVAGEYTVSAFKVRNMKGVLPSEKSGEANHTT